VRSLSVDDIVLSPKPDLATAGELPAHARISAWLEQLIGSERLRAGDKLPPEVDVAAALGVSRMTLRHALAALEAKGLLERRRGRSGGNFVTLPRFDFNLAGLPGFTEQMRRNEVTAGAAVVRTSTRVAPAAARAALHLRPSGRVHEIIRVRSANGNPIALEETSLPASIFPGILALELTGSLYQLMDRQYGHSPHSAEELVEPVIATAAHADLLHLREGQPLLMITRTSYAVDGTPVEFAHDYFRPDRTRIVLHTEVDHEPRSTVTIREAAADQR
jgi:GntR family transcriptional regulator